MTWARSSVEEHYPDKIGVVGSNPTEPTKEFIMSRTRSVSPDKTACFNQLGWWLFFLLKELASPHTPLPKYPLQKNQSAEVGLAGFLFVCPIRDRAYNIATDNANELPFVDGPLRDRVPINAAGICSGGVPAMLREIVYNELMGLGKTEAVAKEWGAVAAEFEQVCGYKENYTRADVIAFLAHLRKRGLLQSTINKDLKAIKVVARVQGWQFPKLPLRRVSPDEIRRTILSLETIGSIITLGKQGLLSDTELCYLALATTYGLRRVEMARLKPSSFPDKHRLIVETAKGGSKTTHLVPPQIAPYLGSFRHYEADSLTHMFHRIAGKVGLDIEAGYGWHSIRRGLTTELILSEASALNVLRFMRWADASTRGEFGMLAIYAKKDQVRIDKEIFKIHPFLSYWGEGG